MEYMDNRYIAMLDILGMSSNLCSREKIEETIKEYLEVIAFIKEEGIVQKSTLESRPDLAVRLIEGVYFVFDTIVVVSAGDGKGELITFLGFISHLMGNFAVNKMPLRGAISYGDFCEDKASGIFLSGVFKELSDYEKNQNWSGCVVSLSCQSKISTLLSLDSDNTKKHTSGLLSYIPPFKKGVAESHLCINWQSHLSCDELQQLLGYMSGNIEKQKGTEDFLNFYEALPRVKSSLPDSYLPAVYATVIFFGNAASFTFWDENNQRCKSGVKSYSCDPLPNDAGYIFYDEPVNNSV